MQTSDNNGARKNAQGLSNMLPEGEVLEGYFNLASGDFFVTSERVGVRSANGARSFRFEAPRKKVTSITLSNSKNVIRLFLTLEGGSESKVGVLAHAVDESMISALFESELGEIAGVEAPRIEVIRKSSEASKTEATEALIAEQRENTLDRAQRQKEKKEANALATDAGIAKQRANTIDRARQQKEKSTVGNEELIRPWFKKKRYIIPLSVFVFIGFVSSFDETQSDDPSGSNSELAGGDGVSIDEQVEQIFVEGVMPDYVGYSPRQVGETLEAMDLEEREVLWPTRFEPRQDGFEEEADLWSVCEQPQEPGETLDFSYKLLLGWGKDCETYKVVPDFVGMTTGEAYTLARDRGLDVDFSSFDKDLPVCAQVLPAGTVFPAGQPLVQDVEIDVVSFPDCEDYYAMEAERIAAEELRAEEKAAEVERQRILDDPNTFEGGRRFINFHSEWLANDVLLIDEYRRWLDAGAQIDGWSFGDVPDWPNVHGGMSEEAPERYQEEWTSLRERILVAQDAFFEASSLRSDDIYSISEVLPYVRDVRALTQEAVSLVKSIPYPQQ
jgi:hypothetical protein